MYALIGVQSKIKYYLVKNGSKLITSKQPTYPYITKEEAVLDLYTIKKEINDKLKKLYNKKFKYKVSWKRFIKYHNSTKLYIVGKEDSIV